MSSMEKHRIGDAVQFSGKDVLMLEQKISGIPTIKRRIFHALYHLSAEKPYGKITIKDICAHAEVSKSSFYQHFDSKDAILRWHWDLISSVGTQQIGRTTTWEKGLSITMAGLAPVYGTYRSAVRSEDKYTGILAYIANCRRNDIWQTMESRKIDITEKLEFQIAALTAGEQAALDERFRSHGETTVEALVELLISIVPYDLYEALDYKEKNDETCNPWDHLFA